MTSSMVVSTNTALSRLMSGLENGLIDAARKETAENPDADQFTITETTAISNLRALQMTKGIDLGAMVTRVNLWLKNLAENTIVNHPAGFNSEAAMAEYVGISLSDITRERDVVQIIFPWMREAFIRSKFNEYANNYAAENGIENLEEYLQDDEHVDAIKQGLEKIADLFVASWWESTAMGKVQEVLPFLKVLITGTRSRSNRVNLVAAELTTNAMATLRSVIETIDDEEERARRLETIEEDARQEAARYLIEDLAPLPVHEIRRAIRQTTGERTLLSGTVVERGGQRMIIIPADTESEYQIVYNALINTGRTEIDTVTLPEDDTSAAIEAVRIPVLRRIQSMMRSR